MITPAQILSHGAFAFLGAFVLILVFKMVTGAIPIRGVFTDETGAFSPMRMQLLLMTMIVSIGYGLDSLEKGAFVEPSSTMVGIFTGSHAAYLGGKAFGAVRAQLKTLLRNFGR